MLLTNGRIYTLDASDPLVDTLVVRDGRIAFAGRRGEINVPPAEPMVDLGGRSVLPGLVDGHCHLIYLARARFTLNAGGVRSEEAVAQIVAEAAARAGPGEWLGGRGWDQNLWPERQFPTKVSLDRAAPSHSVALVRVDGHATWCNSAALRGAEITRDTPNPEGGIILKDGHGEPTGQREGPGTGRHQLVRPRGPRELDPSGAGGLRSPEDPCGHGRVSPLAAPEPYIVQTVQALKEISPDYIVPMHCSGAAFIRIVQREMPDKLIMSYTGSRYIFGA
jgi:Amidohydrolase family